MHGRNPTRNSLRALPFPALEAVTGTKYTDPRNEDGLFSADVANLDKEASTLDFLDLDDLDSVTDVCFGFVIDPSPRRGQRLAIVELQDIAPQVIDVLESMVLDGIDDRTEIAQYVQYVFGAERRILTIGSE